MSTIDSKRFHIIHFILNDLTWLWSWKLSNSAPKCIPRLASWKKSCFLIPASVRLRLKISMTISRLRVSSQASFREWGSENRRSCQSNVKHFGRFLSTVWCRKKWKFLLGRHSQPFNPVYVWVCVFGSFVQHLAKAGGRGREKMYDSGIEKTSIATSVSIWSVQDKTGRRTGYCIKCGLKRAEID